MPEHESPVLGAHRPLRALFLIRQLEVGGAERQLLTLVRALPRDRCEATVVSMYKSGGLAQEFARVPGVRVVSLDKRGRYDLLGFGVRLRRVLREVRPDVVHGYMYPANEITLVAGRLFGIPVVWGIRVSAMDFRKYNRWTHAVFRMGIGASRWVELAIANSAEGLRHHEAMGLRARRHLVIPNGVDTDHFQRDAAAGVAWRKALGFAPDDIVVSMIGRFDPMKDHATFFKVVAALEARGVRARYVCVGEGSTAQIARVRESCNAVGVSGAITFVPPVVDPVPVYSGSSVVVSTSAFGEGFPNVIGEAMACEVPCVSTDTGDAQRVIGEPTLVAVPGDVSGLATIVERLCRMSEEQRTALGRKARTHIVSSFGVALLVERTLDALQDAVHMGSAAIIKGER